MLFDPKTEGARGTLLYALEQIGRPVSLRLLASIALGDSFEASEQAMDLIYAGQFNASEILVKEVIRFIEHYRVGDSPKRLIAEEILQILSSEQN